MTEDVLREYLSKLGRRGAQVTNSSLTAAERKRKAKKAAAARWKKAKRRKPNGMGPKK